MTNFYEESLNFYDAGITDYDSILAECRDIAKDKELEKTMIENAGSVEEYARKILEAMEKI